MSDWKRVVFAHELGPNDECPVCGDNYSDGCMCPGPTMDGWEYDVQDGVLLARELDEDDLGEMLEDLNEQVGKLIYAGVAMDLDLAMIEGNKGQPVLHAANCPFVQLAREQDKQIFTLFGCQELPNDAIEKHSCVAEAVAHARSAAGSWESRK